MERALAHRRRWTTAAGPKVEQAAERGVGQHMRELAGAPEQLSLLHRFLGELERAAERKIRQLRPDWARAPGSLR